jgi:hypothetical protein
LFGFPALENPRSQPGRKHFSAALTGMVKNLKCIPLRLEIPQKARDSHFSHSFNNNKLDDRDHLLENATASVASLRGLITSTPER